MMPQNKGESINNGAIRFRPVRAVKTIRRQYPGTEFIVVSHMNTSNFVLNLANAGAKGYLLKDDALSMELTTAITTVYSGGVCLSPEISRTMRTTLYREPQEELSERHKDVLQALAFHSNELQRDIAVTLNISEATLKKHAGEIRQRMRVKTTTAAIIKGMQQGIIPIDAITFPEY
jgi:DNA-binding NarL/FixJ family response regulator